MAVSQRPIRRRVWSPDEAMATVWSGRLAEPWNAVALSRPGSQADIALGGMGRAGHSDIQPRDA